MRPKFKKVLRAGIEEKNAEEQKQENEQNKNIIYPVPDILPGAAPDSGLCGSGRRAERNAEGILFHPQGYLHGADGFGGG